MRNLFVITLNELRVNFSNVTTIVFLIVLPIVFTLVLGIALGGFETNFIFRLDVVDLDQSALSSQMLDALRKAGGSGVTVCDLTADSAGGQPDCDLPPKIETGPEAQAEKRISESVSYGAVIIPENFGADLLEGGSLSIGYRVRSGLDAPAVLRQTVDAAVSRVSGSVVASRQSLSAAQAMGAVDDAQAEAFFNDVYAAAESEWEEPPVNIAVETTIADARGGTAGFSQSAPGMACMFVMMNMLTLAESVVRSRQNWTFQRMLVMPAPRWAVTGGKVLAYFVVGFGDFLLIVFFGRLMGVNFGDDLVAVLSLAAVFALTATALGLAVSTFTTTLAQASGASTLLGIVLAPLGGAWWPLAIVPDFMRIGGHIVSPIAWAMDAFNAMIYHDKGLVDILPYLGILLVYAAVFFVVGVWRFRYEG